MVATHKVPTTLRCCCTG